MEAVAHTAAGVFGVAAASICPIDEERPRWLTRIAEGAGCVP
jgi:hypothetical protein